MNASATMASARGAKPGPTLCLTALIHGDERNGFEVARQAFGGTDARQLAGTLIALPAINVNGFRTGSRYMPDRRDLNRAFPGNAKGSNTSLVAGIVFEALSRHCNALVDLHTGRVVWFNDLQRMWGDLRQAQPAAETVDSLMKGFPELK